MDTMYPVDQDKTALSILEKLHGLLGIDRNDAEPNSVEARRRLTFFANSLFMDMPRAPPVSEMLSWSCMTPFYCEDVVYRREDLERENEDGLTTLMYLQVSRPGLTVRNDACCMDFVSALRDGRVSTIVKMFSSVFRTWSMTRTRRVLVIRMYDSGTSRESPTR